jgi:serine/threonine-protein kinase
MMKLLSEDPRRPRDLERSIPEGVEALIQRAMSRDPDQRPESVDALERLLAPFDDDGRQTRFDGAGASGGGAGEADVVTRRARRARPAALAWAIVFCLLTGLAALGIAASVLRLTVGSKISDTDVAIAVAAPLGATLVLFFMAARVLFARWRSAPVIDQLGTNLRIAFLSLAVPLAALTVGARAFVILGPLPQDVAGILDVVALGLPMLVGLSVFGTALWRARRS